MPRIVLRQLFLATALIVLYAVVSNYHYMVARPHFAERAGGMLPALLWSLPGWIVFALPIATGVALSLLPDGRGAFRSALFLAGGMTVFFVFNDLAGRDLWRQLERKNFGTDTLTSPPPRFDDTTSALGGALQHVLGRVTPGDIQPWPPKAQNSEGFAPISDGRVIVRMSAVHKYSQAMAIFLPLLLGGIVVGLGAWLRRIATFRSPRDERVLRLVLGWSVTLLVFFGLLSLTGGSVYQLSSPRASIGWMFVPYLLAAVPSFLGWRALHRREELGAA